MANGGGPFGTTSQFVSEFTGANENLRDYTHASRTFTSNSFELKPRFKFLFHVSFTLNTDAIPYLRSVFGPEDIKDLSLLVKTVDLPKYNIQTHTMNQYNRKRVVQTKVEYQPVTLTFHDDGGDNSRRLWYYYFSYYFKDPAQRYLAPNNTNGSAGASQNLQTGFGYNARDIYSDILQVKDWGYSGESWTDGGQSPSGKPPFFRDIRIYGMDQHKYAEYVLINPIIKSWNHDTYDYAQGNGIMQHSMTIDYETVKYYDGAIGNSRPDNNVFGFADPAHYDTTLSPIARPGSNQTIFGQGGLLDAGAGILQDLQSGSLLGLVGAAQKAMTVNKNFGAGGLKAAVTSDVNKLVKGTVQQSLPAATKSVLNSPTGVFIPTVQNTGGTTGP